MLLHMGFDKNKDGTVDFKDFVEHVRAARWYVGLKGWIESKELAKQFVRLDDVEAALVKEEPTIELLQAQVQSLERKLDVLISFTMKDPSHSA